MPGIDRHTGKVLDDFNHALQSVEVILSTRLGSLIMLREFGGGVAELLGRAVTPALFMLFRQLIATAIDTWEPRFLVRKIECKGTVDEIRKGVLTMVFEVDYRPKGHLGDFTVERVVSFGINVRAGRLSAIS